MLGLGSGCSGGAQLGIDLAPERSNLSLDAAQNGYSGQRNKGEQQGIFDHVLSFLFFAERAKHRDHKLLLS
jgi:hypothetical protein